MINEHSANRSRIHSLHKIIPPSYLKHVQMNRKHGFLALAAAQTNSPHRQNFQAFFDLVSVDPSYIGPRIKIFFVVV